MDEVPPEVVDQIRASDPGALGGARCGSRSASGISGLTADGKELHAAVFDENEVRAAAGLTMVIGAVAFAFAYFDENYVPLQVAATLFFVEFLVRVTTGLRYSPVGVARARDDARPPAGVGLRQAQAVRLDARPRRCRSR